MALAPPVDSTNDTRPPRTYFCLHCSTGVSISKRNKHERSEKHIKSVLYGKLLISLVSLYENRDNLNRVCKNISRAITDHETKYAQIQSRVLSEGEGSCKIVHQKNKNDETKENKDDDLEKKNLMKDEKNDNISTTLTSESRAATKTDPKLAAIEKPDYTVLALSGAKLKVSFDNYHGFSPSGDTTWCRVCRVDVVNRDKHKRVTGHRTKVTAAVKDKHCIRRLTDILNHCMLCNDLVGNSDEAHVASHAHRAALQRTLLQDDVITTPDNSYTKQVLADNHIKERFVQNNEVNCFCQVCHMYVLKSALMDHISTDAHKNGLNLFCLKTQKIKAPEMQSGYCKYCKVSFVGIANETSHLRSKDHQFNEWLSEKDTSLHYHFKESEFPNKVICKICDVPVSDITQAVNEHVSSYDHGTNYNKILKDNHMEVISEYNVVCALCNLNLYMIGVLNHTQNECHKNKLMNCNLHGIGSVEFDLMKENSDSNDTKLKQVLKTNLICNSRDEKYYSCKLCNRCIEKPLILAHIMSKKHTKMSKKHIIMPKKLSKPYNAKTATKEADSQKDVIRTEKEITGFKNIAHLFDHTNEELICILCACTIDNCNETFFDHIKGVKHTSKWESFLLNNDLKEIVDISSKVILMYSCKPCGVDVPKSDLFIHINSEKHKISLSPQPSISNCFQHSNVIKTEPETEEVNEIKTSSPSDSLDNESLNVANLTNRSEYFCEVCNVIIVFDNPYCMKMHADGVQHNNNLELLENSKSQNLFQTKFESTLLPKKIKHLIKQSHQTQIASNESEPLNVKQSQIKTIQNLPGTSEDISHNSDPTKVNKKLMKKKNYIKKEYCITCNIRIPNIKEHVNGKLHKQNLQASSNVKEIYNIFQNQLEIARPGQNRTAEAKIVKGIITMIIVGTDPKLPESNIETFFKEGYCNICNIIIFPNDILNYNKHVKEKQHEQNLQSSNFDKSTVNVSEYQVIPSPKVHEFCHICYVKISTLSISHHVQNKSHQVNLKILNERIEAIVKKDNMLDAVVDSFCGITGVGYLFPEVDHICHICNAIVTNTVNDIIQHVEGTKHNLNVGLLIASINKIVNNDRLDVIVENVDASDMKAEEKNKKQVIPVSTTVDSFTDKNTSCSSKCTNIIQSTENCENIDVDNIHTSEANITSSGSGSTIRANKDSMSKIGSSVSTSIENTNTKINSPSFKTKDDDQDEGVYICQFCGSAVPANKTDLKSHLLRHQPKMKHFKEYCKKVFRFRVYPVKYPF